MRSTAACPRARSAASLAIRLGAQGLGWAVRQEAALLLRHWWPLAALAATRSGTVRRAVVTALLVDVVVARVDHPDARYDPLSRRLDDLAYGAGLWAGALRARSVAALLPRRPGGWGGPCPIGQVRTSPGGDLIPGLLAALRHP